MTGVVVAGAALTVCGDPDPPPPLHAPSESAQKFSKQIVKINRTIICTSIH
jgi:hypothetical protein